MPLSNIDGPSYTYGNMAAIASATFGSAVADPNLDAGPNAEFQGDGFLDPRYLFIKDQLQGFTGKQPVHFSMPYVRSIGQIPAATANNNIASVAGVTSGTALALASASLGVALNIPIVPFGAGGINNTTPVTAAIALDFGFAFANCTSGNTTVTVANAYDFTVGMPLVIAGVGNSGGTIPLLCNVASIASTTTIVLTAAPQATNSAAPVGTGNIWGPSVVWSSLANMTPTAHQPWLAGGPGLFLDPRQAIARGLRIVGVSGGAGGTFTVRGYDIYNMPMTETITVGSGASTGWGVKAWKYITSVTPNFTDAHAYTVGTSDVFGFNYRALIWDDTDVSWNSSFMNSSTGFTPALSLLTASTSTTADVRGTIQTSSNGGGSGIGATASNGTVSSLAMSGVRLTMAQTIVVNSALLSFPGSAGVASAINVPNSASVFGVAPA